MYMYIVCEREGGERERDNLIVRGRIESLPPLIIYIVFASFCTLRSPLIIVIIYIAHVTRTASMMAGGVAWLRCGTCSAANSLALLKVSSTLNWLLLYY